MAFKRKASLTRFLILHLCVFVIKCVPSCGQTLHVKIHYGINPHNNKSTCLILSEEVLAKQIQFQDAIESEFYPATHRNPLDGGDEHEISAEIDTKTNFPSQPQLLEIFAPHTSKDKIRKEILKHCETFEKSCQSKNGLKSNKSLKNVTLKLIDSGASSNRIDVVFMGDGYTEKERSKFFSDMNRLVNETFLTSTLSEFLPLLNVWAMFTPSTDSGISYPGRRKNTYFGLYRTSSRSLRGIFVRNKVMARSTCRNIGPSACDFPVLIGNDPYYGGLGGEFAISTSSPTSGTMVLRHELGHNFARVGEEYDGGDVYSGVNSATSLRALGWRAWLGNSSSTTSRTPRPREERMAHRVLNFPQNDLDKRAYTYIFRSNGRFTGGGWTLSVTLAGAPEPDSVQFLLDGEPLPWKSSGTKDKSIYSWTNTTHPLTSGRHNLTIAAIDKAIKNPLPPLPNEIPIIRSLGSVLLYEFGNPEQFQFSNDIISAYPTLSARGRKTFRPTNNGCLMRNMSHDQFCSVCKESIWLQFLRKVSLIDDLVIEEGHNKTTVVKLKVIPLGQYRTSGVKVDDERLEIRWTSNGKEQLEMRDKLQMQIAKDEKGVGARAWEVSVKLVTARIRNDPRTVALDKRKFFM